MPLDLTGEYKYLQSATGNGVTVYVVDTGILTTHTEWVTSGVSRAKWGFNAFPTEPNTDGHGHGTHCAGTIGGNTYGMAKGVHLIAVKVLNNRGAGSTSGVIEGLVWSGTQSKIDMRPSVVSMSLGGLKSESMNSAVNSLAKDAIVVVAAGNDNKDACDYSPASASEAISVGASDNVDRVASFSNQGPCVELMAPGVSITSAWIGSDFATNTISGTSMAAPHVSGQVAKFLQKNPLATAAAARIWLNEKGTKGLLQGVRSDTKNLLLFADCSTLGGE
jgi:subtilisin family serine protease